LPNAVNNIYTQKHNESNGVQRLAKPCTKKKENKNGERNISIKKMRIIDKTKKSQNNLGPKSYRPFREFKFHFTQDNCDTLNLKFNCFKP
jgi:hypothetical protein